MTDKVPLAEQIGVIDEMSQQQALVASKGGMEGYQAKRHIDALVATRATLVWLMNNADEIKEFRKGKGE